MHHNCSVAVDIHYIVDNVLLPLVTIKLLVNVHIVTSRTVSLLLVHIYLQYNKTPQGVSLLTGVLRGIAQNKTSVEFELKFYDSDDQSYYMKRIPEDILTHFTRDGRTWTLNPLNSRCPTGEEELCLKSLSKSSLSVCAHFHLGGVSSGESPQTPGSNPTEEPSNKRRHIEQSPLVGVTGQF